MKNEDLKTLPKVELHCHLDGSLSREYIEKRLGRTVAAEELTVSSDCQSLEEYLEKFALPVSCLGDEEGLFGAGYDVLKTMADDHVRYAEIRFAPQLSVTETMGTEQVIAALLQGLEKGKADFGVEYNVIVCAMRHLSREENLGMIRTAMEFLGSGVCAADLAGAEAAYPMTEFMDLFGEVRRLGMPFTIHAGECGNARNIADALAAGARRIGHGIAMRGQEEIKRAAKAAGAGIEMCPVSNLQTKAVRTPAEYPMREFLDAGLLVTVNTDNRTVSGTSMTRELEFIREAYGVSDEEIRLLMRNGIAAAFADDQIKDRIWKRLR